MDHGPTEQFETPAPTAPARAAPADTRDRRYKLSNPTSKAGKKAAQSPEEFRQRGPASISFDSIDRRSF